MPFSTNETLLVFRIAGIPFAVPAQSVGSILMPPEHVTHTPGSHRSTPGIFHHAQATYAVIDLHARFGSDTPLKGGGRMLLHEEGIRHFAFLVDEVVGLTRSEEGKWANLPHYLPRDIFPIGFLHQEEIILCSELPLLRDMHDVEPLRRHAEQLKQQAAKTAEQDLPEKRLGEPTGAPASMTVKEEKPAEITAEKTATGAKDRIPSPATPKTAPTTHVANPKPAATPPSPTIPVTAFGTRHKEKPSSTAQSIKPTTTKNTTEIKQPALGEAAPRSRQTASTGAFHNTPSGVNPSPPAGQPHVAKPAQYPSPTIAENESDNAWLWLLLFLLLLIAIPLGYWLWPSAQTRPMSSPRVTTANASVDKAIVPQPIEQTAATPDTVSEPPLRIERDDDGTINLIIDRQAAAQNSPPTAAVTETTKTDPDDAATTAVAEEKVVIENAPPPAEEKTAAEDTPPPASGPEPCDCTHIVVKGDTLWDIAELYTGNAFNYPDLAKRSGIKNPDRIYPGNKVRIIIR